MLVFSGACDIEHCFKTVSKWTTSLFLGRLADRENMPRRFKKDNSSVCLDLGSLVCVDHEVQM